MQKIQPYILIALIITMTACGKERHPGALYQKIYPKDLVDHVAIIKPHKIRYEKSGGFMIYDLQTVNRGGRDVYRLNVYYNVDENHAPDTMFFDVQTLGYLGRILGSGKDSKYLIDVDFNNGHFTGSLTPKNNSGYTPRTYDKTYQHGFFEPAVINYFISALPLKKGYTASLPTLDLNNGSSIIWANIEVVKKETLKIDGKKYETWKVKSHGIKKKTIWVSTAEPYAVKMKTGGSFGTWEIKL